MDLWIRNQDRTVLVETKGVHVCVVGIKEENGEIMIHEYWFDEIQKKDEVKAFGIYVNATPETRGVIMGTYATKQRALEVIDEIQKRLITSNRIILQPKITPINHKLLGYVNKELACDACIVPQEFDCLTVNQNVVVYEVPKE